jgi:hypothetical protein
MKTNACLYYLTGVFTVLKRLQNRIIHHIPYIHASLESNMQAVANQLQQATMKETPAKAEAEAYLRSLLNKTLRVHATDGRMFIGTFKCTDTVRRNIPVYTQVPLIV